MKKTKQMPPQNSLQRGWTPFDLCQPDPRDPGATIYKNSRYQVHIRSIEGERQSSPAMIHVYLRRLDRGTDIPFRDLMRIKRELLHPEIELIELFPAESRLIDTANQYHYWGLNSTKFRFPFGFQAGRVVGDGNGEGAKQALYEEDEKPSDWLSSTQLQQRLAELKEGV
jgi:hypothetical protein